MNKEYNFLDTPSDENIKIYRYLNFSNLVYLLETKKLYFPSAEELSKSDPFEGKVPNKYSDFFSNERFINAFRKDVCISCWHMNEGESDAMWKLYSTNDDGVAVQSTFKKLKKSFEKSKNAIIYSKIIYIDHETWGCNGVMNYIIPFILKNKAFEFEHELRALTLKKDLINYKDVNNNASYDHNLNIFKTKLTELIYDIYLVKTDEVGKKETEIKDIITRLFGTKVIQYSDIEMLFRKLIPPKTAKGEGGIDIEVDPAILIETIYISPGAKPWFVKLVKSTLKKYKLNIEVKRSKLAKVPKIY